MEKLDSRLKKIQQPSDIQTGCQPKYPRPYRSDYHFHHEVAYWLKARFAEAVFENFKDLQKHHVELSKCYTAKIVKGISKSSFGNNLKEHNRYRQSMLL